MNIFTFTITIFGFIATIVGSILAIFTYISPVWRLKFYLKKPKKWKKVFIGRVESNWQYDNHPEFIIELDDESRTWETTERWMNDYPDNSKSLTKVKVKANGQTLLTEDFISLDKRRYFVPLPKRKIIDGNPKYWYTPFQIDLARIIGEYYRKDSIEDFMESHKLSIKINKNKFMRIKNKLKKWLKIIGISILIFIGMLICFLIFSYFTNDEYSDNEYFKTDFFSEENLSQCNVEIISLFGDIDTYVNNPEEDIISSDYVNELLIEANNSSVRAIILEIDSFGGDPVASEEIMNTIKRIEKPVIAVIRSYGTSGAYLVATGADKIFASENSTIGGIGVTTSYLDYSKKNQKEGITYIQLSSGKFKDTLNPDKPLTYEEKQLIKRDLNILHKAFVKNVSENRNLEITKVRFLADGSDMLGRMAIENGLIDEIGGVYEAVEYLENEILGEELYFCE